MPARRGTGFSGPCPAFACGRARSIGDVAKDFDLTETAVREWVKQSDIDDGHRDWLTTEDTNAYRHRTSPRVPLEGTC